MYFMHRMFYFEQYIAQPFMKRKGKVFLRLLEIINWYDYFLHENGRPVWVTLRSLSAIPGIRNFRFFPVLVVFMENMCKKKIITETIKIHINIVFR